MSTNPQREVKKMRLRSEKFNNNKPFEVYFSWDEKMTRSVFGEIYGSEYYKPLVDFLKDREKPVIVDVGANIGLASIYFSQLKNPHIYAIEPNPYNFDCLMANAKEWPCIEPHKVAIGATNQYRFLQSDKPGMSSESMYGGYGEKIQVVSVTMETFLNHNKIPHVDGMKIDVEGAEYEIFLMPGFKEIASQIDFIVGESHYTPGLPAFIPALLEPMGFTVDFLPYANMEMSYKIITQQNKKEYEVKVNLPTIFTAKRNV